MFDFGAGVGFGGRELIWPSLGRSARGPRTQSQRHMRATGTASPINHILARPLSSSCRPLSWVAGHGAPFGADAPDQQSSPGQQFEVGFVRILSRTTTYARTSDLDERLRVQRPSTHDQQRLARSFFARLWEATIFACPRASAFAAQSRVWTLYWGQRPGAPRASRRSCDAARVPALCMLPLRCIARFARMAQALFPRTNSAYLRAQLKGR